jgi:IS5 family transposase
MKQMTFADAEYAGKRKQTRKELFLIKMDRVVPWKGLIALIEPHYPKGEGGRPAYPLMAMLRVHLLQNWFGYSDPAMEEALYETTILRQFAGLNLERIPDETTGCCWSASDPLRLNAGGQPALTSVTLTDYGGTRMLVFESIYTEGLAQISYLVGDSKAAVAAVIDPRRDVEVYLDLARDKGLRIAYAIETHIHADFVSGAQALAERCGAEIIGGLRLRAASGGRRRGAGTGSGQPGSAALARPHPRAHLAAAT